MNRFIAIIGFVVGFGLFGAAGLAQNIRNTDYSPDKALKSNARVNPSTLAMELSIPLGGYAGRAGNGLPITVSYSSKVWDMENVGSWPNNFDVTVNDIRPMFAKRTAAGWSSSLAAAYIDYQWERYEAATQGAPDYDGQIFDPAPWEEPPNNYLFYVKRVRVTLPDGSSHELRASDSLFDCGMATGTHCVPDLTGTFLSVDGSRMRLESGVSSSTLYLPDGSRYVFGSPTGSLNVANTFYDRHGNKMTYVVVSGVGQWTDTMGRLVKDPFPINFNGVQNQVVEEKTVEYPGFNGPTDYDVKFTWATLSNARLDPSDVTNPLRYIGWKVCSGEAYTLVSPYLFSDGGEHQTRICSFNTQFNPVVLTKITLPNGQFYEFKYNVFGEITKITYPGGGYEKFVYGPFEPLQAGNYAYDMANRGVTNRYVSARGDGSDEVTWTYSATRGYYVQSTAPDNSYTRQYLYEEPNGPTAKQYGFTSAFTGRPYDERAYSTSGQMISRKLTVYGVTGPFSGGHGTATRDLRPTKEVSIVIDPTNSNALATMSETVYDTAGNSDPAYFSSLNPKQTKTYHYIVVSRTTAELGSLSPATAAGWFSSANLASTTEITYMYSTAYKDRNITGLVTQTEVKDPTGAVKAKSQIGYDETGSYPIIAAGTHSQWTDPSSIYRANPTTTRSWHDIAGNQYVETHAQYDNFGNMRKSWDGRGNFSLSDYTSTYGYAYPTSATSPIPDSTGVNGSNAVFTSTMVYEFNTGLPTSTTDPNGLETQMDYVDPLYRPTKVSNYSGGSPVGGTLETFYGAGTSESTRWVKTKSQIDATSWKEGYTYFDGLGRSIKSHSVDAVTGDVSALTCYDNMGRASKSTNPFKGYTNQDCSTVTGLEWTTNTFDSAGRLWKVTTPDGAFVETTYDVASLGALSGTVVTAKDQAGKYRRSITNGLGQLIRVDEPNSIHVLGAYNAPNQPTAYAYDTLNNPSSVTQIGDTSAECGGLTSNCTQTRSFSYDALSRLKSANNPESGIINYTYDNSGNLATKIDARPITTTYAYDALNRVKSRTYNDGGVTPTVNYHYDNLTNAKGKLIKVSSTISTTEYSAFDILGRVTASKQITDGVTYGENDPTNGKYPMTYTYNLAGGLIEQQYPSGRVVKNVLDYNGDLAIVQSKKTATAGYWNYANSFTYNAAGGVTSMQLGNGKWESTTYNNRLQPEQIALGTIQNGTDRLKLNYGYGGSNNNGNVQSQTITVPGMTYPLVQNYNYDSLNRIQDATESSNGAPTWKQAFTYDRYGNRNFNQSQTTFPTFSNPTVTNPSVNPANNRFNAGQNYSYDSVGNVTADAEGRTFTYDAENKQTAVSGGSVGQYAFDGDGKRVKKYVPSSGETTLFVYDADGKLVAEYSTIVYTGTDAKVAYVTNDNLGTPRINTDTDGNVTSRTDYHPFGEEIIALGGRSSANKYVADTVRQGFTGYENDVETGLDYAQARMYSNRHGRFLRPDDPFYDQHESDPQSWNLYVYVGNNPLNLVDPTGEAAKAPNDCPNGKVCTLDKNGKIISIEDDTDPIIIETTVFTGRRPVRFNNFQRFFRDFGRWLRDKFGSGPATTPTAPASQPGGGNQVSQPNQVYGPPSPPNPRLSLPSASQRLDNMNGLSRQQAQSQLQSDGFSRRSTTSGGNQRWVHSDGSVVWIMNTGRVSRVPTTGAAQQFGATGKKGGVRVDAGTGQIMRSGQHHQSGSQEIVH